MERTEVVSRLTTIYRKVLNDETIVLKDEMTANDIENWDSLSHMLLIAESEKEFSIRFKLKELNKMRNVGDMVSIILEKSLML
jgi:acyl carrier protein